ncbi:Cys-rich protein [Leptospira sp. GIMC2001]|uniref:Cys-rich protein n=1 Tax=Leptospira sp. GIMC2001 TaxID=1513297 RepID=UPI00234969E1|nr:Cys-rich protein [Leptospira sp. GIMC2001]WCL48324.1 Cys-rich protein [Leptospira sp. GIMC2001]
MKILRTSINKIVLSSLLMIGIGIFSQVPLQAEFEKCPAACSQYYNCVVERNPNATADQKDMLKKGCELNCKKPKYYKSIEACYDKSKNSCQVYWNCITAAVQK